MSIFSPLGIDRDHLTRLNEIWNLKVIRSEKIQIYNNTFPNDQGLLATFVTFIFPTAEKF